MFGQEKTDEAILSYYGKMPLKQIARKLKCSQRHIKYVLYEKKTRSKRR